MDIKSTIEQSKKVKLMKENKTAKQVAEIVVDEALSSLRSELMSKVEDMFQKMQDQIENIELLEPEDGQDYVLTEDDKKEIADLIPKPKSGKKGDKGDKGDDGKDYILTTKDKKEIASKIKVPVVEKVIEKTEVIKPVVTEKAKYEEPEQIATKLNTLTEKVETKVIKGLENRLKNIGRAIQEAGSSGGGGMGNVVHESLSISSATTYVDLANNIAGSGFAIWAYYQGQMIARGNGYTVSGKRITFLFTPQDGTYLDVIYIRT